MNKKRGLCDSVDEHTWTTFLELEVQFSSYRVRLEEPINIWWYVKEFGNCYLGSALRGLIVLYFDRNVISRAILRMSGKWHCNKSLRTYIDSKRAGEFKTISKSVLSVVLKLGYSNVERVEYFLYSVSDFDWNEIPIENKLDEEIKMTPISTFFKIPVLSLQVKDSYVSWRFSQLLLLRYPRKHLSDWPIPYLQ